MAKFLVGASTLYAGYQAYLTANYIAIGATIILIAISLAVFSPKQK